MAAVDGLLKFLRAQNADALRIRLGESPALITAGTARVLSMPPLDATMMALFVAEALGTDTPAGAAEQAVTYRAADGAVYAVMASRTSLSFKPTTAPAAVVAKAPAVIAPAPAPAPRPVPPPPPVQVAPPKQAASGTAALLAEAFAANASDLFLSSGEVPRLRVGGALRALDSHAATGDADLLALLNPTQLRALETTGSADASLEIPVGNGTRRVRLNVFRQSAGLAAAFRPIRDDPPTLVELGLPDALRGLIGYQNGLVLVCGQTGAGKSTTLVALIEQLNQTAEKHIVTLEDPIEYRYRHARSLIHQRELGTHLESFDAGLRAALRESPDVILVGEMRDRATIAAALTAAETGHLVLSTVHAGNAAMAIERIIDAFPEHQQRQVRGQMSMSLRAVVSQRLLPGLRAGERVVAVELLVSTPAVGTLIREGRGHQLASVIQTGRDDGMLSLERSLAALVQGRRVTLESALVVAPDQMLLRDLVGRRA